MDVTIYISVFHVGHLKLGTGTYGVVLEHIKDGTPKTKVIFRGINKTTENRTALLACIKGLSHLNEQCTGVKVLIKSNYIIQAINTGAWLTWLETGLNAKKKPVVNLDLWQRLYDLVEKYQTEFIYADIHEYSGWIFSELRRVKIGYKEETEHV